MPNLQLLHIFFVFFNAQLLKNLITCTKNYCVIVINFIMHDEHFIKYISNFKYAFNFSQKCSEHFFFKCTNTLFTFQSNFKKIERQPKNNAETSRFILQTERSVHNVY